MAEIVITTRDVKAAAFGVLVGLLTMGATWKGASLATSHNTLAELARCDSLGWVTIHFPDGGEFLCTPTEQKPVNATPLIRKPQRSVVKRKKVETPVPETVPVPEPPAG